ncbi:MAG: hypothetical protein WBD74_08355 [Candidatus Aquilonibacter sp.]
MKELRERAAVECPAEEAETGLTAFFAVREDAGGVARMRLHVPMDGVVSLDREVRIQARETRDDQNLNNVVRVAWQPEGTVIFPAFEGTLVVWGEDNPNISFIELRGEYTPPLGAAGQAFDELIGFRIARATAQQFLGDIRREIEARAHFQKHISKG